VRDATNKTKVGTHLVTTFDPGKTSAFVLPVLFALMAGVGDH
jgi:hypothetical protein